MREMAQKIGADNPRGRPLRGIDGNAETVDESGRTACAAGATAVRQDLDATAFRDI